MTTLESPKVETIKSNPPALPLETKPQEPLKQIYPVILIVGVSGSGKSCSLRNLDKEKTKIYNIEKKHLPFKEAKLFKNQHWFTEQLDLFNALEKDIKDQNLETLVFDSFTALSYELEEFAKKTKTGYEIWNTHNNKIGKFFELIKSSQKNIIVIAIPESLKVMAANGIERTERRVAVQGKRFEGRVEAQFTIVLATTIEAEEKKLSYKFITNSDGIVSAKSPMGMFPTIIPNDCDMVIKTAKKYWE